MHETFITWANEGKNQAVLQDVCKNIPKSQKTDSNQVCRNPN